MTFLWWGFTSLKILTFSTTEKNKHHPLTETFSRLRHPKAKSRGQCPLTHTVLYPRTMKNPLPTTNLPLEALFIIQPSQQKQSHQANFANYYPSRPHPHPSKSKPLPITHLNRSKCPLPTQAANLRSQRSSRTSKSEHPSPAKSTPEHQRLGPKTRAWTQRRTPWRATL